MFIVLWACLPPRRPPPLDIHTYEEAASRGVSFTRSMCVRVRVCVALGSIRPTRSQVYAGQNGAITLAFSGSGSLLAAACCDDPLPGRFPIRLIETETGRCRHELREHASMVYSLVWSPGDLMLLSASADGTAKVGTNLSRP